MLSHLKDALRRILPHQVIGAYRRVRYGRTWVDFRNRSLQTTFTEIYRHNLWGGTIGEYYSGPGSDDAVTGPYVEAVTDFIRSQGVQSIVDIGCGDIRVGRQLVKAGVRYHGVDVVQDLVVRHRAEYGSGGVEFSCLDATTDPLPGADLCLIRLVLQHLSNAQIEQVLTNCRKYPYLVVTEHVLPAGPDVRPNVDIHHGAETRIDIGSYVALEHAPFGRSIDRALCEVRLADGSIIRTVSVRNARP